MEKPRLTRITSSHFNGQYIPSKKLVADFFKDYDHSDVSNIIDIIIGETYTSLTAQNVTKVRLEVLSFLENLHDFLMACYLGTKKARKKAVNKKSRSQS